ncbi:MAG: hypothetical protein WAW86_06395 [Gammaproteobacteria bacterium]
MKVLIPTVLEDTHAIYVKKALESIGHEADLWYTADFPMKQTHALSIINHDITWVANLDNYQVYNPQYDIVWYRRPAHPKLPDMLHPDDIENAKKENQLFFQTLWQIILPDALWINPPNSVARVNSKLLQLKIANKIGMNIPNTLISNDPSIIKDYIRSNSQKVVYKSLYPMTWLAGNQINLTYTTPITYADLPSDYLLQSVPGIFQEKIEKQYELRVTYFGQKYIAVKIHSQEHDLARLDWRSAPTKELKLERVDLPKELDQHCRLLMQQFNIVFGCFDFIATPDNEYYFLEVNEQGQFLWIEEVNPDIKMLQAFIDFLLESKGAHKTDSNLKLSDF